MKHVLIFTVLCFAVFAQAQESQTVAPKAKAPQKDDYYDSKVDESKFPSMDVVDVKRKGRYLLGRVVDAKDRQPLIGVLVKAVGKKGNPPFSAATRRNGEFHIMAPPGDEYTFVVTMTKYKTLKKKAE